MIEKELINIILTGKKLFSKEQNTYKFYLDPYEVEQKTKIFKKFVEIYKSEKLTTEDEQILSKQIENDIDLKKIFLQNLEILINYLIKENKYQGRQSISDIKFQSNLYLNQNFIKIFKNFSGLTINKLISIYEYMETLLWKFISNRYINKEFKDSGFVTKFQDKIDKIIEHENERELKNDMLISLLIKFICRYLPNATKSMVSEELFGNIQKKNTNLPQGIQDDLLNFKKELGVEIKYVTEITDYILGRINKRKPTQNIGNNNNNQNNEDVNQENNDEENVDDDDDRDLD